MNIPQTPGKGASPLCTPFADSRQDEFQTRLRIEDSMRRLVTVPVPLMFLSFPRKRESRMVLGGPRFVVAVEPSCRAVGANAKPADSVLGLVSTPLVPQSRGKIRELGDTPGACRKTLKKPHRKNPSAIVHQKSHTSGVVANTP